MGGGGQKNWEEEGEKKGYKQKKEDGKVRDGEAYRTWRRSETNEEEWSQRDCCLMLILNLDKV